MLHIIGMASKAVAYSILLLLIGGAPAIATVINFDSIDATRGPVFSVGIASALFRDGIWVIGATIGSDIAVANTSVTFPNTAQAASGPNIVTGFRVDPEETAPVGIVFGFTQRLGTVSFYRPALLTTLGPTVHPAWRAEFQDGAGRLLGQVSEPTIVSTIGTDKRRFSFTAPDGFDIQRLLIYTEHVQNSSFECALIDDITTTPVPSPASLSLVAVMVVGGGLFRRRG